MLYLYYYSLHAYCRDVPLVAGIMVAAASADADAVAAAAPIAPPSAATAGKLFDQTRSRTVADTELAGAVAYFSATAR